MTPKNTSPIYGFLGDFKRFIPSLGHSLLSTSKSIFFSAGTSFRGREPCTLLEFVQGSLRPDLLAEPPLGILRVAHGRPVNSARTSCGPFLVMGIHRSESIIGG